MSEKNLNISSTQEVKDKVSDVKVLGNPDIWQLICKASSEKQGWMKSTKAMDVGNGVVIQVTTQQLNHNDSYTIAEAVTFIPGVTVKLTDKDTRAIVPI